MHAVIALLSGTGAWQLGLMVLHVICAVRAPSAYACGHDRTLEQEMWFKYKHIGILYSTVFSQYFPNF